MAAGVRRIVPLTLGWEDLPKSVSVEGASDDADLREPVPGRAAAVRRRLAAARHRVQHRADHRPGAAPPVPRRPAFRPVLPGPGEPLEEALDAAGVDMADDHAVAVSHLHNDHAGGLKHFAGRVPVHLQRAELDYGLSAAPGARGARHLPGRLRRPAASTGGSPTATPRSRPG